MYSITGTASRTISPPLFQLDITITSPGLHASGIRPTDRCNLAPGTLSRDGFGSPMRATPTR
jgi:hypothetical protein